MEYELVIDNRQLTSKLGKLQSGLLSWDVAMAAIGKAYKEYMSTKPFASRGSVFGKPWPELSPAYEQYKAERWPGAPILVASGTMSESFEYEASATSMRLFNTADYFRNHQEGIGVPERVSMALNSELKQMAANLIAIELRRKIAGI